MMVMVWSMSKYFWSWELENNHQINEDVEFANKYSFLSNQLNDTYDDFDGDDAIETELDY